MSGPLVLVVEDSPTQSLRLRYVLETAGYRVECVPTAEQALDAFNRGLPDLVVLDYHLPGIQGADLCRQIRLNVGTFSLPVLMLTADDTAEAQRVALESGADDFMPKAERQEVFLLRVQNLLRQSRRAAELAALPRPLFRRPRVLLAGAGPADDARLAEALFEEGCRVDRAQTGEAALDRAARDGFDCLIVASRLPDMDGAELCRRLAAEADAEAGLGWGTETGPEGTGEAPVVILMLPGAADRDALTQALASGADDYVAADSDPALLRARLRAALRRRFLLRQQRQIADSVRARELETLRLRAEGAAAAARAALAERLEAANRDLAGALHRLEDQARVTRTITDNVTSGLLMIDAEGRVTFMNPAAEQMTGYAAEAIADRPLWGLFASGGPERLPEAPVRERPGEFRRRDGSVLPVAWSMAPLMRDGTRAGAVAELVDVTERKRAEQHQLMLMAELSHRVKNTLATVLSIANQTMRRHAEPSAFRDAFDGRIRALAATHNLLADTNWTAVSLAEVVGNEIAPYVGTDAGRFAIEGPGIEARPKAALVLGMCFHELATNAAKYGAFSAPGGRVSVRWRIEGAEGAGGACRVLVEWRESGGPPVVPPTRRGLGRTLIEGGIAYELKGRASLDFEPDGLRCRMEIPRAQLDAASFPGLDAEDAG